MEDFISTEAVILISILCRKMPELLKYILQYSTPVKKNNKPSPIPLLSSQQIQEARLHSSAIIQQALKTIAAIQGTLNAAGSKLDSIAKQRSIIESILIKLHALNSKGKK
jgi:hypothetical protein